MAKRVLIVASVVSFIEWFNKENIDYLLNEKSCHVHVACNFDYLEDTDEDKTVRYIVSLRENGVTLHNIPFARSPFDKVNLQAFLKLKSVIAEHKFDLIHCHTPTVSILTRLAARNARKHGTIVMYTCHGFHFHRHSPKLNWIIYYPVERMMARYTDFLVTINHEDYEMAKKFACGNVRYIPGVGVDLQKNRSCCIDKVSYKNALGIPSDSIVMLSIGELIPRKNHEVIIRALSKLKNPDIYYLICGKGPMHGKLKSLADSLGIGNNVKLLGFRTDIAELCQVADLSAFPSRIEGLGLAGIEALAAGVPLVSSNVHGIMDYMEEGKTGYACDPDDINGFAEAINKLAFDEKLRLSMATSCRQAVESFDISNALRVMWDIYDEILG